MKEFDMSCSVHAKRNNFLNEKKLDLNTFLYVNKNKIKKDKFLLESLFEQYKNYLYKIAQEIASRYSHIEIDELVNEGFEGLLKALEKYDNKEASFLTYAQYWIRMKMVTAARKSIGLMILPDNVYSIIYKIKTLQNQCPNMSQKEIANCVGISVKRVNKILQLMHQPDYICIDFLEQFVTHKENAGSENNYSIAFKGGFKNDYIDTLFKKKFWAILKEELTSKEYFVLGLLFGKDEGARRSLEWAAKVLHVSKERIRQIKESAFKKLRNSEKLKALIRV